MNQSENGVRNLECKQEKIKGQRSLVLKLLTRKVGALLDQTLGRIHQSSIAHLEALGEALLDFGSVDKITARLENCD